MQPKIKKKAVKQLEKIILDTDDDIEDLNEEVLEADWTPSHDAPVQSLLFKLPVVREPLIGSPKDNKEVIDKMVIKMQRKNLPVAEFNLMFDKIHLYMHGYLVNVALKKFPFIRGYQNEDIYQEALCALRFRAIVGFKTDKGMSFINFAKLCIRRHLITKLNSSKNRQKDQSINNAISLDTEVTSDESGGVSFVNLIYDDSMITTEKIIHDENISKTKEVLMANLSPLERLVLDEFLNGSQYKEMADNINKKMGNKLRRKCKQKSIDNSLVRIRQKAEKLRELLGDDEFPIFSKN
jgi:RNA polymerase sporulation-specific sigma factor